MRRCRRRPGEALRAFCACLLVYLGSYALLSGAGRYVPAVATVSDGRQTAVAVDRLVWQPPYCRWSQWRTSDGRLITDANLAGSLYLPLIAFDRARIHPTQRLITRGENDPSTREWPSRRAGGASPLILFSNAFKKISGLTSPARQMPRAFDAAVTSRR